MTSPLRYNKRDILAIENVCSLFVPFRPVSREDSDVDVPINVQGGYNMSMQIADEHLKNSKETMIPTVGEVVTVDVNIINDELADQSEIKMDISQQDQNSVQHNSKDNDITFDIGGGQFFEICLAPEDHEGHIQLEPEDFVDPEIEIADLMRGRAIHDDELHIRPYSESEFQVDHESNNIASYDAEINRRVDDAIAAMRSNPQFDDLSGKIRREEDIISITPYENPRFAMVEMANTLVGNSEIQYVDSCVGQSQPQSGFAVVSVAVGNSQPWELIDRGVGTSQKMLEDSSTMTIQTLDDVSLSGAGRPNIYGKVNEYPKSSKQPLVPLSSNDEGRIKRRRVLGELSSNDVNAFDSGRALKNAENCEPVYMSSNPNATCAKLRVGLSRRSRVPSLHIARSTDTSCGPNSP